MVDRSFCQTEDSSFLLVFFPTTRHPVYASANLAAVNGAINSFVAAAAIEQENDVCINAIHPGVVEDSPEFFDAFPGHNTVATDRVVTASRKSVPGTVS